MRTKQNGFVQNLVIPALILTGIVLAGWSQMLNRNQVGIAINKSVDASRDQLAQVQKVLSWCKVVYPAGNNGQTYPVGAEHHVALPASPADGSWMPLRNIRCPGDTSQTIWSAAREFLPMPGLYLSEWEYRNTGAGIFVRVTVDAPGSEYGRAVLDQLSRRIHADQKVFTNGGDSLEIMYMR